jgi:hypothetical protein
MSAPLGVASRSRHQLLPATARAQATNYRPHPAPAPASTAAQQPATHLVARGELFVEGVVPVGDLDVDVQLQQAAGNTTGQYRQCEGRVVR